MAGGPGEIFSQGERLQAMGLDLPGAARIAMLLRQKGANLPEDIYTTERLQEAILALWRKGERSC
ncbi:MAG: hypothetical protein LJU34_09470 [Oscillospiraceae bacterium]|nr:hypothetical protein [Oscillospiraceae bacterium]